MTSEITIKIATCDGCGIEVVCWHLFTTDWCSDCLKDLAGAVTKVDSTGFLSKPERKTR